MQRSERQWKQYEASAIHEYDILQEDYDDECEAHQITRQRLRRVLGAAKSLNIRWKKARAERDEARGGRNLRRKEAKEYWDRLVVVCGFSAAWKAVATKWYQAMEERTRNKAAMEEWQAERDELKTLIDSYSKDAHRQALELDSARQRANGLQAERAGLQQQLDAIRDDPLSVCEGCDAGQQIVPLQRQCNELLARLEEVQKEYASERLSHDGCIVAMKRLQGRLEEARGSVNWLVKALTEPSMQILPDEIEDSVKRLAAAGWRAGGRDEYN